jgi:hypothetical protein
LQDGKSWPFPHVAITEGAFPKKTERFLDRYIHTCQKVGGKAAEVLRLAGMSVLEDISYTRKDGQFLRWDCRSKRKRASKDFRKSRILAFDQAIVSKLNQIKQDLSAELANSEHRGGEVQIVQGSCLDVLPTLPTSSFTALITSPPYCNRYDYTRTYALELAFLGVADREIKGIRQAMLSCTVEHKEKDLAAVLGRETANRCKGIFEQQHCLLRFLDYLESLRQAKRLNNPAIPRMLRNYFLEMTVVLRESARILRPGSPLVLVNDNVRYAGISLPVDLIFASIAEMVGLEVEAIWVLPRGKGNSSQQMGKHGRNELRKCVYVFRSPL